MAHVLVQEKVRMLALEKVSKWVKVMAHVLVVGTGSLLVEKWAMVMVERLVRL